MKCSASGCTYKATITVKGPTPEGRTENWTVCARHEFELSQDPINAIPYKIIEKMETEYHTQRFTLYQALVEGIAEKFRKSRALRALRGRRVKHTRLVPEGSTIH